MARALVIEEQSGTCSGFMHPHNGYFAGDFHRAVADALPTPGLARFPEQASAGATPAYSARPWTSGHPAR